MATLFFRNPRTTALAVLLIVVAGASAFLTIGRQEDPTITNLFATVVTPFPGAEPDRVEALVTTLIEDALDDVPEVDTVQSTSSTGISVVQVELSSFISDREIDLAWSEIRDELVEVVPLLPEGAGTPTLDTDRTGAFTAILALTPAADRAVPPAIMGRLSDRLEDLLRGVPGTAFVRRYGAPDEEVTVTVDSDRLTALGLSLEDVAGAIRSADAKVSAGRLRGGREDLTVTVSGELTTLDRIARIPVRAGADGRVTRLSDVAAIAKGAREPAATLARVDGRTAILVAARMDGERQVDVYMERLRRTLGEFDASLPDGVAVELIFDQSGYTADRLAEVALNLLMGIALVLVVLFVSLGPRAALSVAITLPLVSLASLATLNAIGVAIHQMSVTGIIVALGLMVDAAIVMTDEIRKRLVAGAADVRAVGEAVRRLAAPLAASTATTALAFTPMALLPGPAGDFVGSIAISVIVMLTWSLIVALTITPALSGWLLRPIAQGRRIGAGVSAGAFGRAFASLLRLSVRRPRLSILYALVVPLSGFLAFPTLTPQFFPGVDRDQLTIEIELAPGASLGATAAAVEDADAHLARLEDVLQVTWVVGESAPAFYYNLLNDRDGAPHYAKALVTTRSPEATGALVPALQEALQDAIPHARVIVRGLVQGPPVAAPVEIRLVGPDPTVLRRLGEEARAIVAAVPDVTVVRTSVGAPTPKLEFVLDEEKVRAVGLDLRRVAAQLDAALEGVAGGTVVEGTEELPVRVRWPNSDRAEPSIIATLDAVPAAPAGAQSGWVPLSALGTLTLVPTQSAVDRRNGERVNTVQAFVRHGVLPEIVLAQATAALQAEGFTLPPGYRIEVGGDADARAETLANLLGPIGLIVTLTVVVIVLTFNSFRLSLIALGVMVLSAGLSMVALAALNLPFGIQAVIGVIGSIGVSVNAAIIIITALQADEAARGGERDALVSVVLGSTRHILSTTLTTFGGFLPLILAGGGFWPPFAVAVAGGVLLSTLVSYFLVPQAFLLLVKSSGAKARHAGSTGAADRAPVGA